MSIERDPRIEFHEAGTLISVTRWIRTHDEGIGEWLKNARRAYQPDRADVAEEDRAGLLLFQDSEPRRPARIGLQLGVPASTVHRVLCRLGLNRLAWMDRPTGRVIRRIVTDHPGELVHVDVKKLGRIPDGGGWRAHGREAKGSGQRRRARGMSYAGSGSISW